MNSFVVIFLVLPVCCVAYSTESTASIEDRLAVLQNKRPPVEFVFAFHANQGKLRFKQYLKGSWSKW